MTQFLRLFRSTIRLVHLYPFLDVVLMVDYPVADNVVSVRLRLELTEFALGLTRRPAGDVGTCVRPVDSVMPLPGSPCGPPADRYSARVNRVSTDVINARMRGVGGCSRGNGVFRFR